MTEHLHREFVDGCFRCDLSRDEVNATMWHNRIHLYMPDGIDDIVWHNVMGYRTAPEAEAAQDEMLQFIAHWFPEGQEADIVAVEFVAKPDGFGVESEAPTTVHERTDDDQASTQ